MTFHMQMANYIPLYFTITSVLLVIGVNTPQSLAMVLPIMGLFLVFLVAAKYGPQDLGKHGLWLRRQYKYLLSGQ
jgi:hypothetical protein